MLMPFSARSLVRLASTPISLRTFTTSSLVILALSMTDSFPVGEYSTVELHGRTVRGRNTVNDLGRHF